MAAATMKLDTLAWTRKKESAGISARHAETQVESLAMEVALKEFQLKLELKIVESKKELVKWFVGIFMITIGATATIIKVFSRKTKRLIILSYSNYLTQLFT